MYHLGGLKMYSIGNLFQVFLGFVLCWILSCGFNPLGVFMGDPTPFVVIAGVSILLSRGYLTLQYVNTA